MTTFEIILDILATRLMRLAPSFLLAFIAALIATPLIGFLSRKIGWLDRPGGLKAHAAAIPLGGGVAIVAGLAAGLWGRGAAPPAPVLMTFLAALLVMAGGAWDDLRPLGVVAKFSIQSLASLIAILGSVHLNIKYLPMEVNYALTLFWLLTMSNALNLIDIMDGLAGSVAGVAALAFGVIGALFHDAGLAGLGLSLSGALAGFLVFNFRPARIFMGDAGSQTVGFLLGCAAILGSYTTFNNLALFAPLLILGVPLADTALVIVIRLGKGASPFRGSPDHVALRLRALGCSVPATVRLLVLATAALSAAATAATLVRLPGALAIYGCTLGIELVISWRLARVKMP